MHNRPKKPPFHGGFFGRLPNCIQQFIGYRRINDSYHIILFRVVSKKVDAIPNCDFINYRTLH